jgi:hypothetical protein
MGPPALNPTCFSSNGETVPVNGLRASNRSLRKYPNPVPRSWLVPDLVTALITAPLTRPYSASKRLVRTWNSAMFSWLYPLFALPQHWLLMSTPSTLYFAMSLPDAPAWIVPGLPRAPGTRATRSSQLRPLSGRLST